MTKPEPDGFMSAENRHPLRVNIESPGLEITYTLSPEHLNKIWNLLQDCHLLDGAKERLAKEAISILAESGL